MMIKTAFTFLLSLTCLIGFSQKQIWKIDSLKQKLGRAKNDMSRILIMAEICHDYAYINYDSSIFYGQKALVWLKREDFPQGKVRVYYGLACAYAIQGDIAKAMDVAFDGLQLAEKNHYELEKASCLMGIAYCYYRLGDSSKAIELFQQTRRILRKVGQKDGLASVAVETELNLGVAFIQNKQFDSALICLQRLVDAPQSSNSRAPALTTLGEVHMSMRNYQLAKVCLTEGHVLAIKTADDYCSMVACLSLSNVYKNMNQSDSCLFYAQKGFGIAKKLGAKLALLRSSLMLAEQFEKTNPKEAIHYHKIYEAVNEELYGVNKIMSLQKTLLKEQERQRKEEAERVAIQNQLKQYVMLFILGIMLLIGFILYRNNRQKQKSNARLEAQNRELEIEAALERVRSRTMAMHKSEEFSEVVVVLFKQLKSLGIDLLFSYITISNKSNWVDTWYTEPGGDFNAKTLRQSIEEDVYMTTQAMEALTQNEAFFFSDRTGKTLSDYIQMLQKDSTLDISPLTEALKKNPSTCFYQTQAFFKYGFVGYASFNPRLEGDLPVLRRFAMVVEQTYTRFLDLQKAEAQTREAQIEAALERVRSRSMAMQSSHELSELVEVVYQQFNSLKIANWGARIMLMHPEEPSMEIWLSENDQKVYPHSFFIRGEDTLFVREQWEGWHSNKEQFSLHLFGDKKQEYDDIIFERHDYRLLPEVVKAAIRQIKEAYFNFSRMQYGFLVAISVEGRISSEGMMVLGRFAKVFEQTYTRFLDLQRAEAQAREAQIEAALERVRSHAMTMQQTDELSNVINTLFQQLTGLGLKIVSSWVTLMHTEQSELEIWMTHAKGNAVPTFVNTSEYETFEREMQAWRDGQHIELEIPSHIARGIVERIFKIDINPPADKPSWYLLQHWHSYGYIGLSTWNPATEEEHNIINRFAKVFEQTYTRFLDLQKAEARAIEAARTASLDRVRGEIASMRSTEDLQRITPLIWQELTSLGVPFFRCGVFIMDEVKQLVHTYLSTPDGKSLSVLHLPFDGAETTRKTVQHWYKQKVYLDNWDKQQFTNWMQSLIEEGYIKESKAYQGAEQAPEALALHFVPFNQGMLYVGHSERLSDEQIDLVHRLAEAFAVAYARYEDFVKLEDAKYRVEITLTELQSTQAQLIQSEKLASLGELTAGIAHEIQNPLNFVNNFAEVSAEMVDEMHEELEKGETTEAIVIAADLKTNLEKINHHGQRASSIVKGMLEHSRASTGVKEPTNINALADEYLRLAYHGLRAKDNSFNATIETHFDSDLPKVSVIPQDIGRVLLNLINNAFYAVQQRAVETLHATSLPDPYQPTVTVSTQKTDDQIIIRVQDNGNGIPETIREKIFQPFFTTKPTGQGTGLGLSLAYDIVTKGHSGTLEVLSVVGKETSFILKLPL